MLPFVVKRLIWACLLGVIITFLTFVVFFVIPGDRHARPGQHGLIEPSLQAQFNLHGPLPLQYLAYLRRVAFHGDLGVSRLTGLQTSQMLLQGLPITASLVIGGTIIFLLLAFPIGLLSALRPRSLLDKGLMIFVLIGVSAHPVWLGLVLSYLLGVKVHLFPVAGYCDFLRPGMHQCGGPRFWA